jgi:hypothetical protein
MSVVATVEGWERIQERLVKRLPQLGPDELGLRASADGWPIWAMVGHLAGARVYWLCDVFAEPGAETTPFTNAAEEGWEDRLDVPRGPDELLLALESTWQIVQSCLRRWTMEMLGETFTREKRGKLEHHSRHAVLTRLVMHDAFHCGEVSLVLGMHGLPSMDPWEPPA